MLRLTEQFIQWQQNVKNCTEKNMLIGNQIKLEITDKVGESAQNIKIMDRKQMKIQFLLYEVYNI